MNDGFDHESILKRIQTIEEFFQFIGLKKTKELGVTWDLDSYIKYTPIKDNYIINFRGENRVLINVEIGIVGGLLFVMSGKMGVSVYESIKTDYDFAAKYEDFKFFTEEYRNWTIENIL